MQIEENATPTATATDPAAQIYCRLVAEDGIDEIVTSVLDAADVEILEDLADGPAGAAGPAGDAARADAADGVLLRRLLDDIVRRYLQRQRR